MDEPITKPSIDIPGKPHMRDFWAKYRMRTYILITASQCGVMILILGLMELFDIVNLGWAGFFGIAFLGAAIMNVATITLVHLLGRPFRDLVQAIVLVSGEPSTQTPPNPNDYEKRNDGFKDILQTVYEMSARGRLEPVEVDTLGDIVKIGLESTKTGVVILDSTNKVVYHNNSAPTRSNMDDSVAIDLFFPENDDLMVWLTAARNDSISAERQWTRVSDKLPGEMNRRIFDVVASYRRNSKAEVVLTMFDRTNAYAPEEDDLDFISFAAHELRGPITVIRGYLDVLEDELGPALHPDQLMLINRLTVTSNRLTSYVNNILNAAKYDRRHLQLHLTEENLHTIYDTITDDMQLRASAQNRVLAVDIPENLPTVAADANSIGEVIGNLLDNAIKYSNEGGLIHVTARPITGFVEVSVVDRGIGMPSNIMQHLFHKFYRSHRSRETVAGTGIGLYICKAIVSSHGGAIYATSIENEGSTFSFTLPIYDTVAQKLKEGNNSNVSLIEHGSGWIKNHSMYRG